MAGYKRAWAPPPVALTEPRTSAPRRFLRRPGPQQAINSGASSNINRAEARAAPRQGELPSFLRGRSHDRCPTSDRTAPDEQTAMRYPTRASFDHRRLQVLPSPLHDPSLNQLHAGARGERPGRARTLDKGHQRKRTRVVAMAFLAGSQRFPVGCLAVHAYCGLRSAWFRISARRTPALLSCRDTSCVASVT
jgi:hypothetical protein